MSNVDRRYVRLAQLVEQHGAGLRDRALTLARDQDDAEDLLQEVWLIALRRVEALPSGSGAHGWLRGTMRRAAAGQRRTRRRRERLLARWATAPDVGPGKSPSIRGERFRVLLWREVNELPELQKKVLLLRVVEGLSTSETASVCDRAEGTVKASLHRALRTLRRKITKPEIGTGADEDREVG